MATDRAKQDQGSLPGLTFGATGRVGLFVSSCFWSFLCSPEQIPQGTALFVDIRCKPVLRLDLHLGRELRLRQVLVLFARGQQRHAELGEHVPPSHPTQTKLVGPGCPSSRTD